MKSKNLLRTLGSLPYTQTPSYLYDLNGPSRQPPFQRPCPTGYPPYGQQYAPPSGSPPFPAPHHAYVSTTGGNSHASSSSSQTCSFSAEEDMRRLFDACKTARGNAEMLHEALIYATPKNLQGDLIQEFRAKCRTSQELLVAEIPRASADAERSRSAAHVPALTTEEQLLQELLAANEQIVDVFKIYDDIERVGVEAEKQERLRLERVVQVVTAISGFTPTPDEKSLIDQVLSAGDTHRQGTISIHAARKLLRSSNLEPGILSKIWELANVEGSDQLNRQNVGAALRLVGHAQAGTQITETLLDKPGPVAFVASLSKPVAPVPLPAVEGFPPINFQNTAKYTRIFSSAYPVNGLLDSKQAGELFLKSKLPRETLSSIWDLADTRRRGMLDKGDFAVAMYLIEATMSGHLTTVPSSLPRVLYEQLGGTPPSPPIFPEPVLNMSLQLADIRTESASFSQQAWNIAPAIRAEAERIFTTLDTQHTGRAEGDAVVSFMFDSGLSMRVLERIWDMADTSKHGYLTQDEFAVVMHLISIQKAAQSLPGPSSSSSSFVLPSVQASTSSPQPQSTSEAVLIDLSDTPPLSLKPMSTHSRSQASLRLSADTSSASLASRPLSPTPSSLVIRTPPPEGSLSPTSAAFRTPPASPSFLYAVPSASQSALSSGPFADPPAGTRHHGISAADRARSDGFFDTLDPWRRGYIDGDTAVSFFSKSKLPDRVMAEIWDLADMDRDGRLDRDEFALAMLLIRRRLRGRASPGSGPPLPPLPPRTSSAAAQPATSPQPQHAPQAEPAPALPETPLFDEAEERSDTPPPPYTEISVTDAG